MALFGKMDYLEFLKNKRFVLESSGFDIDQSELNPMLYDFQKDIVRWALKKGKACIFADCGHVFLHLAASIQRVHSVDDYMQLDVQGRAGSGG